MDPAGPSGLADLGVDTQSGQMTGDGVEVGGRLVASRYRRQHSGDMADLILPKSGCEPQQLVVDARPEPSGEDLYQVISMNGH